MLDKIKNMSVDEIDFKILYECMIDLRELGLEVVFNNEAAEIFKGVGDTSPLDGHYYTFIYNYWQGHKPTLKENFYDCIIHFLTWIKKDKNWMKI